MSETEDEIQLVIKAPNQNIEDHIVECNLDWTVGELKEYLSEEYPSKPDVLEQRLIYSGRLLHNHLHLRDILRYDEDEPTVHTLHLVCNSNSRMLKSQKSTSSQKRSKQSTVQSHISSVGTSNSSPSETLRQRNTSFTPETTNIAPSYPTSVMPPLSSDPQLLAQMTAMQQMYTYYVNQYMQSMNATAGATTNSPVFSDPANFQPNRPNTHEIAVQRPANQRINAQAGQVIEENDELGNRDWLDHLFLCCRFFILFSIVYFYSTPERLMIVIVCAVIAFLYHEGWFVRRTRLMPAAAADVHVPPGNQNQVQIQPNVVNNGTEPLLVNQDLGANENLQDGHELELAMDGNDPPHAQNADVANNNERSFSTLNFISAFFTSLIPEPPPPVNIN